LHYGGRRTAVRECRLPRAAGRGTPLGRADRGARGAVARAGGTRARAVHTGARPLAPYHPRCPALGRRPGGPRLRGRHGRRLGATRAADLMLEMQRGRSHLALVLDEFGGTAGLVTFEDLLRDLMSEIFEPQPVEPPQEALVRVVELEGSAPASRLEEAFDVTFGSRDVQTVGGLLVQALGRI